MKSRATWVVGAVALAVCLLCPLVDLFDQWDRALQTGHDSEYPLLILALCVGLAFLLWRMTISRFSIAPLSAVRCAYRAASKAAPFSILHPGADLASGSPPLNLRI